VVGKREELCPVAAWCEHGNNNGLSGSVKGRIFLFSKRLLTSKESCRSPEKQRLFWRTKCTSKNIIKIDLTGSYLEIRMQEEVTM
jgi:hypothetical protein